MVCEGGGAWVLCSSMSCCSPLCSLMPRCVVSSCSLRRCSGRALNPGRSFKIFIVRTDDCGKWRREGLSLISFCKIEHGIKTIECRATVKALKFGFVMFRNICETWVKESIRHRQSLEGIYCELISHTLQTSRVQIFKSRPFKDGIESERKAA